MPFAVGSLASDWIVRGRSYEQTVTLDPAPGKTNADVIAALTGATCTSRIVDTDGATQVTASVSASIDAANRSITLSITAANTSSLTPGRYRWDVYVTTSGGAAIAVRIPGIAHVRALAW